MQRTVLKVAARGRGSGGERTVLPGLESFLKKDVGVDEKVEEKEGMHELLKEIGSRMQVVPPTKELRLKEQAERRRGADMVQIARPLHGRGTSVKEGGLAQTLMTVNKGISQGMRNQEMRRPRMNGQREGMQRRRRSNAGDGADSGHRRVTLKDWESSRVRAEAVTAMEKTNIELSNVMARIQLEKKVESKRPFGAVGLPDVVKQVPAHHWAADHLRLMGTVLERNSKIDSTTRHSILRCTLESLNALAGGPPESTKEQERPDEDFAPEERYADAEAA